MRIKKSLLILVLSMMALLSAVAGLVWSMRNYVIVEYRFYPKGVQQLDLRDREITLQHYEKLIQQMPDCEILWKVPFQGKWISSDTAQIEISSLSQQDIPMLPYFGQLKSVKAENCTDYEALQALRQQCPDLKVEYTVTIGTEKFSPETEQLTLPQMTAEEMRLLAYLPNLKQLHLPLPQVSAEKLIGLQRDFPNVAITWEQEICGQILDSQVSEIDLSDTKITDLEGLDRQMAYFPEVELVFLGECGLDNDLLAEHREKVRDRYKLVWTVSCGDKLKTRTDATTFMPVREHVYYFNDEEAYNLRYCEDMVCMDIGHMSIHSIEFVAFMPDLEYLILAHTQVQSIEPISTCKKLKFLELDWSPVKDLSPLKGCTALEDLNLGKVYGDFTAVGEMTWLKNLWMVECSPADRYRMFEALPDTKVMRTGDATVANGWRKLENYYKMRDLLGMYYMSW